MSVSTAREFCLSSGILATGPGLLLAAATASAAPSIRAMLRQLPLDEDLAGQQLAYKSHDDLRLDLAAALEGLPHHYLEAVLLRDFEELTTAEIAQRLGQPTAEMKSCLHRARQLIRGYLICPDGLETRGHKEKYKAGNLPS